MEREAVAPSAPNTDRVDSAQGVHYWRFRAFHRILHAVMMVSFLGLAITGLPLRFSTAGWAKVLANGMGGFQAAGFWHRVCAVVTFGYFGAHLLWVFKDFRRSGKGWIAYYLGPDSLVPRLKDINDLYAHVKWFLGVGARPRWDRWTYWEKFDYWAVFWGVGMIGLSGLILWFPVFFSIFLPGWAANVAMVIHSEEALLAVGFIFTIHFFNTHMRAEKFPMDRVIFTGRVTERELREERPEEYYRLVLEGRLETIKSDAPPSWMHSFSSIVGFAVVGLGFAMVVMILYAVFRS